MFTLHSYWRSSAAYRVRIALALKGLAYETVAVNLLQREHKSEAYLRLNPAGLVPTLVSPDGDALSQSLAILEWLEETVPEPALLPADPLARARVRSMAYTVACEIHPLNNMGVLNHLRTAYGSDEDAVNEWMYTWLDRGFTTLERQIDVAPFCVGDSPTLADVLLVPMVYNALRFEYPLDERQPRIHSVWEHCNTLPAFQQARPENQPDAE